LNFESLQNSKIRSEFVNSGGFMLTVRGVYDNGKVFLKEEVTIHKSTDVLITFLEESEICESSKLDTKLDTKEFSFDKARKLLKELKGSLSEAVIQERRQEI
jgi:hypothetical protein